MTITGYQQTRLGKATVVTVTSDLSGGVYFHWYLDGSPIAASRAASRTFLLDTDDQVRIEVIDTNDPDFDPLANAPAGYPARRLLWWLRSLAVDAAHYRVEQKRAAAAWTLLGTVWPQPGQWAFELLTPRLDDLTQYRWRVVPVDQAGNDGAPLSIGPEKIVRTPDAPDFEVAFDEGTTRVTFAEAA